MTFVNFNQFDTKNFQPKRDLLAIALFVGILVSYVFLNKSCEKELLEDSSEIHGVIVDKTGGFKRHELIYVSYFINGEKFVSKGIKNRECYASFNIGDTVLVKYSIESPRIARIVNCE